jgi:hypothetical protein
LLTDPGLPRCGWGIGLHPSLDNLVRFSKVPVAAMSAIRGRARGAGSELILATDIRFASDRAVLGQFEVGVTGIKQLVDVASLPDDTEFAPNRPIMGWVGRGAAGLPRCIWLSSRGRNRCRCW